MMRGPSGRPPRRRLATGERFVLATAATNRANAQERYNSRFVVDKIAEAVAATDYGAPAFEQQRSAPKNVHGELGIKPRRRRSQDLTRPYFWGSARAAESPSTDLLSSVVIPAPAACAARVPRRARCAVRPRFVCIFAAVCLCDR